MKRQRGYLLEIPLIVITMGILLAILIPILPKIASKILISIGMVILIGGFYYMLIIPGWQPNAKPLKGIWKWSIFVSISLLLLFIASSYVFS